MKKYIVFLLTLLSFSAPTSLVGDTDLLDDLSHRSFLYFLEHSDPVTGLVLDRAPTDGSTAGSNVASIAATGFGLTAFVVGAENHWIDREAARLRVLTALKFLAPLEGRVHGWYYHWLDFHTGQRILRSEVSSIDTSFFLAGVLTVRQYFSDDPEIVNLATQIYEDVDFQWMLDGNSRFLSHGWYPETGFIKHRWDNYSEFMLLYVLAIGSPRHGISPSSWSAWSRDQMTYEGISFVQSPGSLFVHQYSHGWLDFRGLQENFGDHINWFENSAKAILAHRAFCINLSKEFKSYSDEAWGITASDGPRGYVAWGGPPRDTAIDGTLVPSALTGSLMFVGNVAAQPLRKMFLTKGIYRRYGFVNAFNPLTGWLSPDSLGIDVGITLLSTENFRSHLVWKWFMRNPEIEPTLKRVGFVSAK